MSPDDPRRDYVTKRDDYAEAGVPEYWIIDPHPERVTVLTLRGNAYIEHGTYHRRETASSATLAGLAIDVGAIFDFGPSARAG